MTVGRQCFSTLYPRFDALSASISDTSRDNESNFRLSKVVEPSPYTRPVERLGLEKTMAAHSAGDTVQKDSTRDNTDTNSTRQTCRGRIAEPLLLRRAPRKRSEAAVINGVDETTYSSSDMTTLLIPTYRKLSGCCLQFYHSLALSAHLSTVLHEGRRKECLITW